ncbi:MAG: RDD family protein [Chromatiales bacterium]|nr:RDD family protein [Chromatiales bacterium]
MSSDTELPHCPLWRRLAAILYDSLLLLALLFIVSAIHLAISGGSEARTDADIVRTLLIVLTAFAFFAWFWLHGGQTLGMRAWRIRLQNRGGGPITPWQALLRFLCAILSMLALALGFLWSLVDRERYTWHDRFSMTELVVLPKERARK